MTKKKKHLELQESKQYVLKMQMKQTFENKIQL